MVRVVCCGGFDLDKVVVGLVLGVSKMFAYIGSLPRRTERRVAHRYSKYLSKAQERRDEGEGSGRKGWKGQGSGRKGRKGKGSGKGKRK